MQKTAKTLQLFLLALFVFSVAGFTGIKATAADTRVTESEYAEFETGSDPYYLYCFGEEYSNQKLLTKGDSVDFELLDDSVPTDGLIISGKNKNVANATITFKKSYDFGTGETNRIRIDALAERTKKIYVELYLDEEETPFLKEQIQPQSPSEEWFVGSPQFFDISDVSITGQHYITVKINDVTTEEKKKTSVLLKGIKFYKKSIPVVNVNIDETLGTIAEMNNDIEHKTECYGDITIDVPDGYSCEYISEGETAYTGGTYSLDYIRGRGNSTWTATKKPYKIKLAKKTNLFGMGANKHWVLIANYFDTSLIKNRMSYHITAGMGMEFTPQLVPVDLVMNGTYLGSYYLCEQIRIDESRVDIDNLEDFEADDDNITGGYLLGLKPYPNDPEYSFFTTYLENFVVESPAELSNEDVPATKLDEMNQYIENYIQEVEDAIFADDFKTEDGVPYSDLLDVKSVAQYHLFQSFSSNYDAYQNTSTKFYKKRDGKLYWGPLWDFDYVAWLYNDSLDSVNSTDFGNSMNWIGRLLEDEEFYNAYLDAWGGPDSDDPTCLYNQLKEVICEGGLLDQYKEEMKYSADANFDLLSISDTPPGYGSENLPAVTYSNIEPYFYDIDRLREWIKIRMDWYEENIESIKDFVTAKKLLNINFYDGDDLYSSKTIFEGKAISDFPVEPTKEGYLFAGWYGNVKSYDENSEEIVTYEEVTDETFVLEDMDLHAKWLSKDEVIATEEIVTLHDEIYISSNHSSVLQYELLPLGASNGRVKFTVDNKEMLMIKDSGIMFPLISIGDVTVTITTMDGVSKDILVHINTYFESPLEFNLSESEISLNVGELKKIGVSVYPTEAETVPLKMVNTNPEVATLSQAGVVQALSEGTTTIYVSTNTYDSFKPLTVTVTGDSSDADNPSESKTPSNTAVPGAATSDSVSPGNASPDPNGARNVPFNGGDQYGPKDPPMGNINNSASSSAIVLNVGAEFSSDGINYVVTQAGKAYGNVVTGGAVVVNGYVTTFGKGCKKLIIPDTVSIMNNTFAVTEIYKNSFKDNKYIKKVIIGDNIVEIGNGAFKNCKKLKKAVFGKNVANIGKKAFKGCRKLKKLEFTSSSCTFGKKAFKGIKKKAKFVVPKENLKAYKKALKKVGIKESQIKGK